MDISLDTEAVMAPHPLADGFTSHDGDSLGLDDPELGMADREIDSLHVEESSEGEDEDMDVYSSDDCTDAVPNAP